MCKMENHPRRWLSPQRTCFLGELPGGFIGVCIFRSGGNTLVEGRKSSWDMEASLILQERNRKRSPSALPRNKSHEVALISLQGANKKKEDIKGFFFLRVPLYIWTNFSYLLERRKVLGRQGMGGNKDLPFVHYYNLYYHNPLQACPPLCNL